jgi:dinuclear metal center YbgI/SA1388 family protein
MVKDFKHIMEQYAPSYLKESYDNVGLMVGDLEEEVTSILVALDCTLEVIKEAIEKNCNLILTHHPLLFIKPSSITTETLQGKKIIELVRNNINLYSSHTNLDVAAGGLNDLVTEILGYNEWSVIEPSSEKSDAGVQGIGRMIQLKEAVTLKSLCEKVKTSLNISQLRYAGDCGMLINKIAIVNGSGEDYFKASVKLGADCIITGDTSYHYVSDYSEMGVGIIDAGHFETEWPPMKRFAEIIQGRLKDKGFTNRVILSEKTNAPYKFY